MNNSIDWLIAYFGIVRTGAWVVPLNFRFTGADVKYCCDVAEPKLMVFDEEFTGRIDEVREAAFSQRVHLLRRHDPAYAESFTQLVDGAPATRSTWTIAFDDPCGLYFTSGTTGQPKPILLTHKNMAAPASRRTPTTTRRRKDNFILIPPLYHTGAKMHWFGSFIVGGKAVILKGVSPEWILDAVSEEGGTIVWLLVPWAQDILLKLDSGELKPENYKLDQWRLMHIGAQPVPPEPDHALEEVFPRHAVRHELRPQRIDRPRLRASRDREHAQGRCHRRARFQLGDAYR